MRHILHFVKSHFYNVLLPANTHDSYVALLDLTAGVLLDSSNFEVN